MFQEGIESKSNKASSTVDNSKAGSTKKCPETTMAKKGHVPSKKLNKTGPNREMIKLLQLSKKQPSKEPPSGNETKQAPREWKPPIERGGGTQTPAVVNNRPAEKMPPVMSDPAEYASQSTPPVSSDTWKKCTSLNESLRKCLKNCDDKREDQMTDYEVRRKLSIWLESISQKALTAIVERISRDASFKNGTSTIDALEIKTVRDVVRMLQTASRRKSTHTPMHALL